MSGLGLLITLAASLALAEPYDRPPDTSQANLEALIARAAAAVEDLQRAPLFVDDPFVIPREPPSIWPGFELRNLANEMATRLEVRMGNEATLGSADLRDAAEEQNGLAEDIATTVAASAKSLKPEFQPPTCKCLSAFYECKAFLATQGEGWFSVEFGCGFTYLFCMAERVIPLAGG